MKSPKISNMLLQIFLAAVFFFVTISIVSSGKKFRETKIPGTFKIAPVTINKCSNVVVQGDISVQINSADSFSVFTNDTNLYNNSVRLFSENDTLKIESQKQHKQQLIIRVDMPDVNYLELNNKANIEISHINTSCLNIKCNSSNVNIEHLQTNLFSFTGNQATLAVSKCEVNDTCYIQMQSGSVFFDKINTQVLVGKITNKSNFKFNGVIGDIRLNADSTSHVAKFVD